MSDVLLARYASCLFWFGRYLERAESLARVLDVNDNVFRDSRYGGSWASILQIYADEERYVASHGKPDAQGVLRFYVLDGTNPSSLRSVVRMARENARTLRPIISTEMWQQINVFHNRLSSLSADQLTAGRLSPLLGWIKEACQTQTGIAEGTFHRDQAWHFWQLGRVIERADQTTRLLDIKYHLLLPTVADVGTPVDVSQWNVLLRSLAGYQAYLRSHPNGELTPARVAGFLLFNTRFPRSVYVCVRESDMILGDLKSRYGLRGGNDAAEELDRLRAVLGTLRIGEVVSEGLHEFLDLLQKQLNAVTLALYPAFFEPKIERGVAVASAGAKQTGQQNASGS